MLPWLTIATSLLPDLIKIIAGDKAGTVAKDVAKAVQDTTGAQDPAAAQKKVKDDPATSAALQQKLAEIALDAAKAQNEEEDKKRADEIARMHVLLEDTQGARSTFQTLAQANSIFAWGAPAVSVIVTIGFFSVLLFLINQEPAAVNTTRSDVIQIVNILIGTLAAGFATVINFWLGSSLGSRNKDTASVQLQATQAAHSAQAIKSQAAQTTEALKTLGNVAKSASTDGQKPDGGKKKPDNFEKCLAVVLIQEGGYTNDPQDPGGPTNLGITQKDLSDWLGHAATADDVKALSKETAREIYRSKYWNPLRCDELPAGIDLIVFDFGVNAGLSRSVKTAQKVIGVKEDGSIGPITMGGLTAVDPRDFINSFSDKRLAFYQSLSTWPHFGKGWTRRTEEVKKASLAMAG